MKRIILLFAVASSLTVIGFTSCKSDKTTETSSTTTTEATTTTEPTATMASQTTDAGQPTAESTNGTTPSSVQPAGGSPSSVPSSTEGTAAASPTGPSTSIKFTESTYDYGKVVDGTTVKHTYKFTNTGKEPLIISDAKGSCGCTVPQWPKDPIAPGASGEINVQFDSKGKVGPQNKTVTVTANTNPPKTTLTIKGEVTAKPK